jgi:hypothetical protein
MLSPVILDGVSLNPLPHPSTGESPLYVRILSCGAATRI